MRVEAPVAGAKGLWQRVEALWRATLPRQARVTRTEGNSVWVKFLGDGATDPESKFPSTVAGVPVATMGWVITLGGRKGLFVATGQRYYTEAEVDALIAAVPKTYSIQPYTNTNDPFSTTSIDQDNPYWYSGNARSIEISPGQWAFDVSASIKLRRSVTTGGYRIVVSVDGQSVSYLDYQSSPLNQFSYHGYAERVIVNAPTAKTVNIRIGFCGWSTAGTTYGYLPTFTGTYQRIGDAT